MKIKVEFPHYIYGSVYAQTLEVEISDEQMTAIAKEIAARLYTSAGHTIGVDTRKWRTNDLYLDLDNGGQYYIDKAGVRIFVDQKETE